ncbi:MAG: fibronectin type III domain-containing protein [Chloroflexi bacterium]|nr:fibronectin type III domain-containing protein [Chloroflexota bacterium]
MSKLSSDHVQVLVDGYDITGDSNHVSINEDRDVFDITAFRDKVRKFIPGQRMMAVQHAGFMNSGEAGSHPVLKGADLAGLFSIYVRENAEPAVGDPVFSMLTRQGRYGTLPQFNRMIPFQAVFANQDENGGWGVALTNPRHVIGSSAGGALDNGASTDGGGLACLHVLDAAVSDAYAFSIEGSDSGAFAGEESVLATFALDGRTIGSEQVKINKIIPRYVRWVTTADPAARDRIKIAISLIRIHKPVPFPQGLLADFKFATLNPNEGEPAYLLNDSSNHTGNRWLNLTKTGGLRTDISLEALVWGTDASPLPHRQAEFGGWEEHDWELLPSLLPNSSFYIHLPNSNEIFEFAMNANSALGGRSMGFSSTPRPASIAAGSQIRLLVANSSQASRIKNWIAAGNQPETVAPPDKPQPPSLVAGAEQATVTITPPARGGSPITTYELSYRESGATGSHTHVPNLNALSHTVMGLTNGTSYEFRVTAINRAGRGEWSDYGNIMLPPPPQGLLTDFEFSSRDPSCNTLLGNFDQVTGSRWLNLTKTNGKNTDIEVQIVDWKTESLLEFSGTSVQEWEDIPSLLSSASFYIYLYGDNQIYEFPVSANTRSNSESLRFASTARPTSIEYASSIRVLVADSGQANRAKDWIVAGNRPQVIEPPAKPQPPTLTVRSGEITAAITPPAQGGAPITTYELDVRHGVNEQLHLPNINTLSHTVMGATSGDYRFRVAAINRGGRGPWSDYATATAQSSQFND